MEDSELIKIADDISKLMNNGRVYDANIISELHANENAHSRILRMFLQYDDGSREYPIFRKFIDIPPINNVISNIECKDSNFTNEQERIDVLIEGKGSSYAIIIENKIYGAVDQETQLERYIDCVIKHGVDKSNIYAVYLTKDGEKVIDNCSLTKNARNYLEYNEENKGRFIPLSYRYDILPWLEKDVLPNCTIKEELLISALKQYIDYLKKILGINEDKEKNKGIMTKIREELGINNIRECNDVVEKLKGLTEKVNNLRDKMVQEIGNEYIKKEFENFLEKKKESYSLECEFSFNYIRISVFSPKWNSFYFKVNYENPMIYGLCNKDVKDPYVIENRTSFNNSKFKKSNWWPAWKSFERTDFRSPQNIDFWNKVERGEFEKYLEEKFEEILKLLEESNFSYASI